MELIVFRYYPNTRNIKIPLNNCKKDFVILIAIYQTRDNSFNREFNE